MCPFCYIGKRRFESALNQFENKEDVEIVWKSFQLNPQMKTDPNKSITEYLAEVKGWTIDYARQMNAHVTAMAKEVGLEYDFDKAIVANSFDAHRLVQLAKKHGKGDAAEEGLFRAYFTEGKNIADHSTLASLAADLGLDKSEVTDMLAGNRFAEEVEQDVYQAQRYGARGVPFFVMNEKYGVSGAQSSEVFSEVLEKSFSEWNKERAPKQIILSEGQTCTPDGDCN